MCAATRSLEAASIAVNPSAVGTVSAGIAAKKSDMMDDGCSLVIAALVSCYSMVRCRDGAIRAEWSFRWIVFSVEASLSIAVKEMV